MMVLGCGMWSTLAMAGGRSEGGEQEPRVIEITASQFEFTPSEIEVSVGESVRLLIRSTDVEHGIAIPTLGIGAGIPPGGDPVTIDFVAAEPGRHRMICTVFCGAGHGRMSGTFIVVAEASGDAQPTSDPDNVPDLVDAQMQAWEDNGYFSINYSYLSGDRSFQESLTASVYDEVATYSVNHVSGGGGQFNIGAGLRVWRNLAAGITVSSFSTSDKVDITGSVPHPLFFDRPRTGRSAPADLKYKELGVHIQAVWVMPLSEKISVAVAGGPSVFYVDQSQITRVGLADEIAAPWNTVALGSATTTSLSQSGIGGNAAVDVTYLITEQLGGGLFVGWARGTVDVPGAKSIAAGGVQVGIGLRARF